MIESYAVTGINTAVRAIGLSYGDEFSGQFGASSGKGVAMNLVRKPLSSGELGFLTGIHVNMVVNASIKWWQQAERYHFFQIVMSQGVMHQVTKKAVTDWEFTDDTPSQAIEGLKWALDAYERGELSELGLIYSVPVGLKEKARVSTNYLQLLTMYEQRKNHKLKEWHSFCDTVKKMPMMGEIIRVREAK